MNTSYVQLAVARDLLVGIAPFAVGLVVVVALILAVAYGIRLRSRGDSRPSGPVPPHPDEPVVYESGRREPDEIPRDGGRLLPHELKEYGNTGSRPAEDDEAPKWSEGSSGGFGSGGPGRT
ncbi:DUF6479 family protein [Streptomyces sp. NPDC054796]